MRVRRGWGWMVIMGMVACLWAGGVMATSPTLSRYAIAQQSDFNHPDYYPVQQAVDETLYQPVADWVGRLILPDRSQVDQEAGDWVWLEILNAPEPDWVGRRARLQWQDRPDLAAYLQTVTQPIAFTDETRQSIQAGNVHPERLDGWPQVGPLQSLAGAHPEDDVIVALPPGELLQVSEPLVLQISEMPTQVIGQYYGLVQVLGPSPSAEDRPDRCPSGPPCVSEQMQVRHYNLSTGQFDGPVETVRIPQVLPAYDIFQSTPHQLHQSPAGQAGWYIYGAQNAKGVFVVQAIAPRSLLRYDPDELTPEQRWVGRDRPHNYINFRNWQDTPSRKGTVQTAWLHRTQSEPDFQEDDRFLVVHVFGGIGGERAETPAVWGTVTGHFAYGTARLIRDRFTDELRFQVDYFQVYSHNPNGIIAGAIAWENYMGGLQAGWLGTRPVSDVLIKLDAVTEDYRFGDVQLSVMDELRRQLQIMMARYRTGDGTGAAIVTPAQSCVQDSSQALYKTIQTITQQVSTTPAIQQWLREHPNDPQTQRFQRLVQVGDRLRRELVPVGIVRPDWQHNANAIAGAQPIFERRNNLVTQLLSWRTVIPRVAYDQLVNSFLEQGAGVWVLRTNQVGGWDATIAPLAPTELFGRYWVIPTLFSRAIESLRRPTEADLGIALFGLLVYGAIALPLGWRVGFLTTPSLKRTPLSAWQCLRVALAALVVPALLEEGLFRVLLLPHPREAVRVETFLLWTLLSVGLFVLYHPLNGLTLFRQGAVTFRQPAFLLLAAWLGLVCTGVYAATGSLWAIALVHWVIVVVWLLILGGYERLYSRVGGQS
ncbi:MAG: CPBP family glutamic-type intramembrane protease [Elainellaceae cyanobacterium]